ncbi:hypothetical protein IWX81_002878 [Salinibacterium sp. CAN_S4]|uniref:hypothetical protein n=1 Tax=Salinibacterium sp. CAN_S4 TaxID=2787727 RepID=UPI0018EFD2E3
MTKLQLGLVEVETRDGARSFRGTPLSDRDGGEREGSVRIAKLSTPDGLVANVGVTKWPDEAYDQRLIDFVAGPDPYRRLERAGNMSLNTTEGGVVAVLRALKYTSRELPSLQAVGWPQLDEWLGEDAQAYFLGVGAVAAGTHGELRPEAGRFVDEPAIIVDPHEPLALFAAYALTRVIPIATDFGRDGVEVLN